MGDGSRMDGFSQSLVLIIIDKLAIGALIVIAGYYGNKLLEKYRAEQNRSLEVLKSEQELRRSLETARDTAALEHLQRQIEELFSPLLGLIELGNVVNWVERTKVSQAGPDQAGLLREYFAEKHYLQLNTQMSNLIRSKIYLLDSDHIPPSYKEFLRHAAAFECLHELWKDKGVNSDDIKAVPYPSTFKTEVEQSLEKLRSRYNEEIKRINTA